jgi:serine/threonine protein kinase
MGLVYAARSRGGRRIAVKVIRAERAADPGFRQRFAREVEAARRVGGFHTAQIVAADPKADLPWMATAYIDGPSLLDLVRGVGSLPVSRCIELARELAEGLAAIHECDLVHRDLKPGNLLMAADGVRIIDFGIASALGANPLTSTGVAIGTFAYMSPEQVAALDVGPASDVFSFGGVLTFAATGHGPFDADGIPAIVQKIAGAEPDLGEVQGPLRRVIVACLAKAPEERPSAAGVLELIDIVEAKAGADTETEGESGSGGGSETKATTAPPTVIVASGPTPQPGEADVAPSASGTQSTPPTASVPNRAPGIAGDSRGPAREAATRTAGPSKPAVTGAPSQDPPEQVPATRRPGPRTLFAVVTCLVIAAAIAIPELRSKGSSQTPVSPLTASPTLLETLAPPDGADVDSMAFAPDGTTLATGGYEGNTYLWNTATGKVTTTLAAPAFAATNTVNAVAFAPDGTTLATGDDDDNIYLWNTVTGKITTTLTSPGTNPFSVQSAVFSPNGTTLATTDGVYLYLWDTATGKVTATLTSPGGNDSDAEALAFSPDGAILVGADGVGDIYLWDTATGRIVSSLKDPGASAVTSVAFAPNGTVLATGDQYGSGSSGGDVHLWDIATRKVTATLADPAGESVNSVAFAPNGTALAVGDGDGTLESSGSGGAFMWDTVTGKVTATYTCSDDSSVHSVAFAPNGRTLAVGCQSGDTDLWRTGS